MAFGVNVDFNANLTRFTSAIDKATSDLSKFQSNADRIGGNINKIFSGLGAGLSVGAFVGFIKGSVDALDNLNDLNKKTGISVEQLSGLSLAARQSGTDLEGVAGAINKLSKNIGDDSEKFRKLGITAKEPLEAFKQLADIFVAIDDPQKRAALGSEAIGKAWEASAPLLAEGGKNIGEMVEKGMRLSNVTTEAAQAADKFNDQLAELKEASNGLGTKIASDMVGPMADITNAIKEAYDESGKLQALWVAMGALGGFLFTDEFASARTQIKNLGEEIEALQAKKKNYLGPSILQGMLIGTDEEIDAKINAAKAKIAELQKSLQPKSAAPATKPATDPDLEKRVCEFGGGVWDGKTCKKPEKNKDDPSQKLLDNSIKDLERQRSREADALSDRNKVLDLFNDKNIISLKEYYGERRAIQESNIASQVALFDKEIKALEAARSNAGKKTEKAELTGKINDATEKKAKLQRDASTEAAMLTAQEQKAYEELAKQVRSVSADLLELQGRASDAAKIRVDDQFKPLLDRLSAQGDSGSAKLVQDLKAAQIAMAEFSQSSEASSQLMEELRRTEERLAITRSTGAISELEYLNRISEARADTAKKLEAEVAAQEKLGQSSGLKNLQQQADAARLAMEQLRSQTDLVAQKFKTIFEDGFSDPFADFITGTKSASEAFKSFANSVIQQMARMAAQNVAQSATGGLSSMFSNFFGSGGSGAANAASFDAGNFPMLSKGGVFESTQLTKFAKGAAFTNSIVSSPTLFKFAKGAGLMGEAGPEAIMPLKRGRDGSLGVMAQGGAGSQLNVTVINNTPAQVSTRQASDGGLEVLIDAIDSALGDRMASGVGSNYSATKGRFGLREAV